MCTPCTHIIIIQIMINNVKLHSITTYKHEMNMKLYALTFKVGKCIIITFLKISKHSLIINQNNIAQAISNKSFPLSKQKVITKMT